MDSTKWEDIIILIVHKFTIARGPVKSYLSVAWNGSSISLLPCTEERNFFPSSNSTEPLAPFLRAEGFTDEVEVSLPVDFWLKAVHIFFASISWKLLAPAYSIACVMKSD